MFFTIFASVAIAVELDLDTLVPPKTFGSKVYDCVLNNNHNVGTETSITACYENSQDEIKSLYPSRGSASGGSACQTTLEVRSSGIAYVELKIVYQFSEPYGKNDDGSTRYVCNNHSILSTLRIQNERETDISTCPPDGSPDHIYEYYETPESPLMCAREIPNDPSTDPDQKDCADLVGLDSSFYGVTVNKKKYPDASKIRCLENGAKLCETTSTNFIDTNSTDTYVRYSPVGGGTFTGNECKDVESLLDEELDPPPEDKFCTVNNASGIYTVDCPLSQIAINWNTVKGLAEASAKDNQRIANIEASFLTKEKIAQMVANNELGDLKGEKGDKGDRGEQGLQGGVGATGAAGADGKDGEDGENCNVIATTKGAMISCAESTAEISNGDSCSTIQLANGDAQISCEDGTMSEINGVDEDGIVGALNTQLDEMKKQTGVQEGSLEQLEFQTEELKKISTYDGEKPLIDYQTKPDAWTEIAEFDWEQTNFGTVLETHMDELKGLPLFSAIDNFFVTSFGGACPTWQETVTVLDATFTVTIDQFCSSAVQNILPAMRVILLLVAGFFAWRIAIE